MGIVFHFLLSAQPIAASKRGLKMCGSERPVEMVSSLKQTTPSDRKDERCMERERERERESIQFIHTANRDACFSEYLHVNVRICSHGSLRHER